MRAEYPSRGALRGVTGKGELCHRKFPHASAARGATARLPGRSAWKPPAVNPDIETPRDTDQDPDAEPATTPTELEHDSERDQAEGDAPSTERSVGSDD